MNLKKYWAILPLAIAAPLMVNAEEAVQSQTQNNQSANQSTKGSEFHFSTEVSRTVEQDLMRAELFSRKTGKSLPELKKQVSANLNKVLEIAKQYPSITVSSDGVRNYADYQNNKKVERWVADGSIYLESKDFEAMAKVLESLGEEVAINDVRFSVSKEKMQSLEDEMTLDIIKQFQHKADVIQKGINAKSYTLTNVQLNTPNGSRYDNNYPMPMMAMAKSAPVENAEMPLEAGKQTITATASGSVKFE